MRQGLFIVAVVETPEGKAGKVVFGPSPIMAESAKLAEYAAIALLQKKGTMLTVDSRVLVEAFGVSTSQFAR